MFVSCCLEPRLLEKKGIGVEMNEAHHGRVEADRETGRGMTGGPFHRVSHGKQSGISGDAACFAFPPALLYSLLNFYWIWNVKRRRRGGLVLSHSVSVLFLYPLVFLYLSAVGNVTQREPSLRQLMQTRLISWCSFQSETEHTEKKFASQSCVKLGVCPLHLFWLSP